MINILCAKGRRAQHQARQALAFILRPEILATMHYTSPVTTASYIHRSHIRPDTGAETSRHRRDSTSSRCTPSSHHHHHQPWHQMAHAYAWVDEHDNHIRRDKQTTKTEQWVLEQRVYFNHTQPQPARVKAQRQKAWDEVVYTQEVEADEWTRRETEIRRRVMQRELERARIVQEELRRTEERIRMKREAERQKMAEERANIYLEKRAREKREQERLDKAIVNAWTRYETRWAAMQASSDTLTFSNIPWPLPSPPNAPEEMSPADIASFLLSPLHSKSHTRKERIRIAQLRWHPDRFRKFMSRIADSDKAKVEDGVGIVARCLNVIYK